MINQLRLYQPIPLRYISIFGLIGSSNPMNMVSLTIFDPCFQIAALHFFTIRIFLPFRGCLPVGWLNAPFNTSTNHDN